MPEPMMKELRRELRSIGSFSFLFVLMMTLGTGLWWWMGGGAAAATAEHTVKAATST